MSMQCFGTFKCKEEAARAYDLGSIFIYKEEAVLNFSLCDYWDFEENKLRDDLKWRVPDAAYEATQRPAKKRKRSRK
jgi:hypothetical protein